MRIRFQQNRRDEIHPRNKPKGGTLQCTHTYSWHQLQTRTSSFSELHTKKTEFKYKKGLFLEMAEIIENEELLNFGNHRKG